MASAVLRRAGTDIAADAETVLGVATTQVAGRTPGTAWREALDAAGGGAAAALRSTQFLADEYAQVVLANRITSREAYYKVRRPGRGVALDRAKRAAVWQVIEAYRAQARIAGSVDFAEAATIAAVHLRRSPRPAPQRRRAREYVADHVLVDEGRTSAPRTGSSCGRWSASTPTTCSSPRTPTSASTASGWRCRPVRHPHRRQVPAADPELPDHRAEPRLRDQRAQGRRVRRPRRRTRSPLPGTGRRAAAPCPG